MGDTRGTGCGIWPLILKGTRFDAACEWHDNAYTEGSFHEKNLSRRDVDAWFLMHLKILAGNSTTQQLRARLFYGLARLLGGLWWEGKH